jgi:hypothetical protein
VSSAQTKFSSTARRRLNRSGFCDALICVVMEKMSERRLSGVAISWV